MQQRTGQDHGLIQYLGNGPEQYPKVRCQLHVFSLEERLLPETAGAAVVVVARYRQHRHGDPPDGGAGGGDR